jgi:hypothetical protein
MYAQSRREMKPMTTMQNIEYVNHAITLIILTDDFDTIDEQFDCIEALRKFKSKLEETIK